MIKYIPPHNFNMILDDIYRSCIPTDLNYPFLERLKLKTIVYLSTKPISDSLKSFCEDTNIEVKIFADSGVNVKNENKISENLIENALNIILRAENLPLMIMSEEGNRMTGIAAACIRKKQKWNLSCIFEEYRRYDGPDADLESEQFIELFDPDLITVLPEDNEKFGILF